MTRPAINRSGRCCQGHQAAWCWSPAAAGWPRCKTPPWSASTSCRPARRRCYRPLAIGMLASQLRHHPAWSPAELAADVAAARDRLALMRAEDVSVGAAFTLSYTDLTVDQQRLFRRLGLHPGPSIDAYAAAALDGTTLDTARRGLGELYDQHLLTEPTHGRY